MERFDWIDIARGSFFFPMFIFHIFSLYDEANGTDTASQPFVSFLGNVRLLYIIMAGVSLYLSAQIPKSGYFQRRFWRSAEVLFYGLLLTALTTVLYPDRIIRFGILHFIAVSTLLVSPIAYANSIPLTAFFLVVSVVLSSPNVVPSFSPAIDVVVGGSVPYSGMDWFPLVRYLPILLLGLLIAQLVGLEWTLPQPDEKPDDTEEGWLIWMGTHSLELYVAHFIVLMVVFYVLSKK